MITTDDFNQAVYEWVPELGYEDNEDEWANLFERDDQADVYALFDGLRHDCD